MDENQMLAYHEAGHIVVGRVLGLEIEAVTIEPDEQNAGRADVPIDLELIYDADRAGDHLARQLTCYVAGAVAEELLTGKQVEFVPGTQFTGDWNGAADCVLGLAGDDENLQAEISQRAFDKARSILEGNWNAVVMIAYALQVRGSLDRATLLEMLRGDADA